MTKKPRILVDNGYFHVIQRGHNKKSVFHESEDYARYAATLARYLDRFDIQLLHYCLMPNHIHLLVSAVTGNDLPRFMHGVNICYGN